MTKLSSFDKIPIFEHSASDHQHYDTGEHETRVQ